MVCEDGGDGPAHGTAGQVQVAGGLLLQPGVQALRLALITVAGLDPVVALAQSGQVRYQKVPVPGQGLEPQRPVFLHRGKSVDQHHGGPSRAGVAPFQVHHAMAVHGGDAASGIQQPSLPGAGSGPEVGE